MNHNGFHTDNVAVAIKMDLDNIEILTTADGGIVSALTKKNAQLVAKQLALTDKLNKIHGNYQATFSERRQWWRWRR